MGYRRQKRARYSWFQLESEILQLRKALNEARLERDILKKATVDSIGQRNSYVKTWDCGEPPRVSWRVFYL